MNFDPLHITFGLYIAAMIGIGIVTYFKTANYGEYILGGRGLGSWVTAISAQAAATSASNGAGDRNRVAPAVYRAV